LRHEISELYKKIERDEFFKKYIPFNIASHCIKRLIFKKDKASSSLFKRGPMVLSYRLLSPAFVRERGHFSAYAQSINNTVSVSRNPPESIYIRKASMHSF
jgi:hypothetical protein